MRCSICLNAVYIEVDRNAAPVYEGNRPNAIEERKQNREEQKDIEMQQLPHNYIEDEADVIGIVAQEIARESGLPV